MQREKRKRWIEGAAGNQTIRHCPLRGSPLCAPRVPLGKGSLRSLEGGSKAAGSAPRAGVTPHTCGHRRGPALPTLLAPLDAAGTRRSRGSPATSRLSSLMTHRTGAPVSYSLLNLAGRQSAPCNSSAVRNVQRAPGQRLLTKRLWMEISMLLLPQNRGYSHLPGNK